MNALIIGGQQITQEEQIAIIFYGQFGLEGEIDAKKEQSRGADNATPKLANTAVAKVGLKSKHRTGKKRERSRRTSTASTSSEESSRIRSDSIQSDITGVSNGRQGPQPGPQRKTNSHIMEGLSASPGPTSQNLNVPMESGAANLNPPSRIRGRRLSFDVTGLLKRRKGSFFGRRGSEEQDDVKDEADEKGNERSKSIGVGSLISEKEEVEETIPLLVTMSGTDPENNTEHGRRCSLVEKFKGMDFKSVSEPDLRKLVCRMPGSDDADEEDMMLWFSHSTQWMVPLVMAGEISNPPQCFIDYKDFQLEEERGENTEEDNAAEEELAKPASDPRWMMARRWVETVIRPELQQTNFLKKLTFSKRESKVAPEGEVFVRSRHGQRRRTVLTTFD